MATCTRIAKSHTIRSLLLAWRTPAAQSLPRCARKLPTAAVGTFINTRRVRIPARGTRSAFTPSCEGTSVGDRAQSTYDAVARRTRARRADVLPCRALCACHHTQGRRVLADSTHDAVRGRTRACRRDVLPHPTCDAVGKSIRAIVTSVPPCWARNAVGRCIRARRSNVPASTTANTSRGLSTRVPPESTADTRARAVLGSALGAGGAALAEALPAIFLVFAGLARYAIFRLIGAFCCTIRAGRA